MHFLGSSEQLNRGGGAHATRAPAQQVTDADIHQAAGEQGKRQRRRHGAHFGEVEREQQWRCHRYLWMSSELLS